MRHLPLLSLALVTHAVAQGAPPGYYSTVDTSSAAALRATLHNVIDGHVEYPYTSSSTDTWDILELAQEDPNNSSRIIDIYRNASYQKQGGGNSTYNREHSWPSSYGLGDASDLGPFTDCHQLFLCDDGYNSARSNKPFADCQSSHSEYTTFNNNGVGGGSGPYPGNSNWTFGSFQNGSWEVWDHRKGDIARAQLYMDVRYEGDSGEPDLILTDDRGLMGVDQPYHGDLTVLLQWHLEDPPDADEMARNDVVYSFQGNRNPFIDHPEWVAIIWGLSVPTQGSVTFYGSGCNGGTGSTPLISSADQDPRIGDNQTVSQFFAPANAPTVLHFDFVQSSFDLGFIGFNGCTLLALPTITVNDLTDGFGSSAVSFLIPNHPNLVGNSLMGQWLTIDAVDAGLALTQGLQITVGE